MHLNLQERLSLKQAQLQQAVQKINALEQEKQQVIQEALRLDGAVKEIAEQIEAETKGD
jgi:uncharacterized protein (UPF0335 family)